MATGYTLMFSVVHGNVVGAVIAPHGTENFPKDKRMFVWRAMIQPLIEEVARYEEFPEADAKKVAEDLFAYCVQEGLVMPLDRKDSET